MSGKNINLNELYKLPMVFKLFICIGAILAVLGVVYFLSFSGQLSRLTQAEATEAKLKTEYIEKAGMAAGLEGLQQELKQIEAAFGTLLKQLPTESEVPNLIQELHQAGATNGMSMDSVRPNPPVLEGQIETLPYSISVTGNYEQIARFASDVGLLSRIVTLDQLNIVKKAGDKLTLTAIANTYRVVESKTESDAGDTNKKGGKK